MLSSTEALGIPELLSMILENARPQDVLLWQGVNKTWQAAIQRSPRIQEKLFFKVKPCKDENEGGRAVLNPFMRLFLIQSPRGRRTWVAQDAFGGKSSYPTASWRQMLITSPAVTELELSGTAKYYGKLGHAEIECLWSIFGESGVTIGQLAMDYEEGSLKLCHDSEHGKPTWVSGVVIYSFTGKNIGLS